MDGWMYGWVAMAAWCLAQTCTQTRWRHFGERDSLWQEYVCVCVDKNLTLRVWKYSRGNVTVAAKPRTEQPLDSDSHRCGEGCVQRPDESSVRALVQ